MSEKITTVYAYPAAWFPKPEDVEAEDPEPSKREKPTPIRDFFREVFMRPGAGEKS